MSRRRTWTAVFTMGRVDHRPGYQPGYVLCGVLEAPHEGRLVDLRVARGRLQSLVVNLAAESGLFPTDDSADMQDRVNRLRILSQLGMPAAQARALVFPEESSSPTPILDRLTRSEVEALLVTAAEMYDTDGGMDTGNLSERQAELLERVYALWQQRQG